MPLTSSVNNNNIPSYLGALCIANTTIPVQRDISLLVAVAYMNTHPVRVLFDPGSQVNTISPKAVERLQLKPDVMQRVWELRMPGNTTTESSLGFYQLCFHFAWFILDTISVYR